MTKIIIGITGSIAAYKSIDLAKLLIYEGFEIEIILSRSAADFVSPLTLRSLFPGKVHLWNEDLDKNDKMLHIALAKAADLVLISPASANIIAKLAGGQADCLLSTICLATKAPILLAPAMNKTMWENEFVQANVNKLKHIIGPAKGLQACGDDGFGRMVEPVDIVEYIKAFNTEKILQGKKIVITAGPTIEAIDPVRFISNYSSGKMGYALARIAQNMGAEVTLISGPTYLATPSMVKIVDVISANDMLQASLNYAKNSDIFIGVAAVADYTPNVYTQEKIKKTSGDFLLKLKYNLDIIRLIKKELPEVFVVGFAAETNNFNEYGLKKLHDKNLDMIAINDVSDKKTFGHDYNELHVITKDKKYYFIERATKNKIAHQLLQIIYQATLVY